MGLNCPILFLIKQTNKTKMKTLKQLIELVDKAESTLDKADAMLSEKVLERIKSQITFK